MAGTIEKRGVSGFTLGFDRLQTQHSSPNVLLSLVVCHLQVQESLWSSTVFFFVRMSNATACRAGRPFAHCFWLACLWLTLSY